MVVNMGPATATNVIVNDSYDYGTVQSISGNINGCSVQDLTGAGCNIGNIAKDVSRTINVCTTSN